jgi:hypothetical protein
MDEFGEAGNLQGSAGHAEVTGRHRCVFISYASADAATGKKLCSALDVASFPCWMAPRNVVPGTLYAEGIVRAIDESAVLVLILSEQAIASAHVGRELERVASKRHPIIALKVDPAPLTPAIEYFLNQSQWVRAGAFLTRLNVASNRPNDGTWMYRLGRLAMEGVMLAGDAYPTAVTRKVSVMA